MSNKKKTGSYYTPKILSDFLVKHIFDKYVKKSSSTILEPSCGDGQFIESIFNNVSNSKKINSIDFVDINLKELIKASKIVPKQVQSKKIHDDYLKYYLNNDDKKYSLIIGNPPYIKKKNLEPEQIKNCELVHEKMKSHSSLLKSKSTIKNIWPAFVEANILSLDDNGILCLVIPAEILQVKYAKEMRELITDTFDRVEVFAFNELIFEGIQQDVVALIGIKGLKDSEQYGFSFYQVDNLEDLKEPKFTEKHSNIHRTTLDKWTNYILSDEELNFIEYSKNDFSSIKYYTQKAEVGIVSAANDYFILSDEELTENKLNTSRSIIKKILPKGYHVPKLLNFNNDDFSFLKSKNVKVNFIHFPDKPRKHLGKMASRYIDKGEGMNLHDRYKMKKRKNWYHVPNTWPSEGLFVKRSHTYPKMFVNSSNSLATDSFYRLIMKSGYNINSLVFSFYNSLTFVLSELEGRYYGGGVLELTPNEFKNLSIPYCDITDEQFSQLDAMLRNDIGIEEILNFTNPILLKNIDYKRLEIIRKKLVNRRLKKRSKKEEKGILEDTEIVINKTNKIELTTITQS